MSKNITISEGSQAKNFNNVAKIRTNVIGGGTQNWIPEDEAADYADLGAETFEENGTYFAQDSHLDGFNQVTVNVQPDLTTGYFTENGTYYARNEGADGFESVEVNVSGGGGEPARLITREITQNGIYNAADDGADGYSSVNVNVAIPHGTILVGSNFNNAPVSQRLSPKDFLRSLCEATYNVAAKYITNASYRARFEQDMAEMTWINDYFPGIYDRDDLVFFGAGGHPGGTGAGIYIWFWCIGIADESATISASKFITDESISGDGCDVILSSGNKFYRSDFNRCGSYSFARIPIINTEGYQSAIENISNHTLESESASPYTRSLNRSNLGTSVGTYNTGLMTNLTGGSLS